MVYIGTQIHLNSRGNPVPCGSFSLFVFSFIFYLFSLCWINYKYKWQNTNLDISRNCDTINKNPSLVRKPQMKCIRLMRWFVFLYLPPMGIISIYRGQFKLTIGFYFYTKIVVVCPGKKIPRAAFMCLLCECKLDIVGLKAHAKFQRAQPRLCLRKVEITIFFSLLRSRLRKMPYSTKAPTFNPNIFAALFNASDFLSNATLRASLGAIWPSWWPYSCWQQKRTCSQILFRGALICA